MKNKKLLVLVLAAFSASTIGAVGALTGCEHEHSYTWQSNAEGHWEECECGEKGKTADHVDVKNNSTDANGKDGKCDVCDYEIKQVVTFNVGEHGTAPDAQNVSYGAKATKPADPDVEGLKIGGWYIDANFETAFDFDNDVITDNTVLYAKWVEDDTPGLTAKYAYDLADGAKPLTAKGYVYFKYTATENGRYKIETGNGAINAKCYFTTSLDKNGETYGYGQTEEIKKFDLAEGDSITIKLSCSEKLDADTAVTVSVSNVTGGDPLPADAWYDGLYIAGAGLSFTLDRNSGKLNYNEVDYDINYVGGAYGDYLSFYALETDYTVKHNADGSYAITTKDMWGQTSRNTLNYFAHPATSIPLSAFAGIYEPADGAVDRITQFNIGEDGTGAYTQNGYPVAVDYSVYDEDYNYLTFSSFVIMLNTDANGNAVSITLLATNLSSAVTYNRVGDAIPTKLPLAANEEYEGATYKIYDNYGYYQYLGDNSVSVTGYDKENNVYTVESNDVTYKLKFEGEGNNTVIKMYAEDGETLLDTLIKYFIDYKDLPTAAEAPVTMPLADFKKGFYHFKVSADGWYVFDCTDANVAIYYNMNEEYATSTDPYWSKQMDFSNGAVMVYLQADSIVGVNSLYEDDAPESVSFSVITTEAPMGLDESNPIELNDFGETDPITLPADSHLYVKFTPPSAGGYLIKVSYTDGYGNPAYLLYTVDGVQTGFDPNAGWWGEWIGDLSNENPNYQLIVSDTTPVWIVVDGIGCDNVVVTVAFDYTAGATELEFTDTTSGNTLTQTANVTESGNYYVADTLGSDLVITSDSAFTAMVNGINAEVVIDGGVYTLTVPAGKEVYVIVSSAVTFTMSYEKGSAGYPIDVTFTDGGFTYNVEAGTAPNFKFTQGGTFTMEAGYITLYLNGEYLDYAEAYTVAAGDVITVDNYDVDAVDFNVGYAVSADIVKGNYTYTDGDNEVSVNVGATTITIGDTTYSVADVNGNTYTLKAEDAPTATLVIGDTLTIDGHELTFIPVFTESQVGYYASSGEISFSLTLNADGSGSYVSMGTFDVFITDNGDGTYSFTYDGWYNVTFSFNEAGNLVLTDSGMGLSNTVFEKSEPPKVEGAVYVGTINDGWYTVTLTLNDDLTEASVVFVDGNNERDAHSGLTVTKLGDTYMFEYGSGWSASSVTFTINADGSVDFTEQWYGSGTLYRQ